MTTGDNNTPNAGAKTMQTHTPDQGNEIRETSAGKRRINQRQWRMEMVQSHTAHRDFRGDTPEVGAVLDLLSEK